VAGKIGWGRGRLLARVFPAVCLLFFWECKVTKDLKKMRRERKQFCFAFEKKPDFSVSPLSATGSMISSRDRHRLAVRTGPSSRRLISREKELGVGMSRWGVDVEEMQSEFLSVIEGDSDSKSSPSSKHRGGTNASQISSTSSSAFRSEEIKRDSVDVLVGTDLFAVKVLISSLRAPREISWLSALVLSSRY
jgi:hypothetical protein